jgi:hypothetical protein
MKPRPRWPRVGLLFALVAALGCAAPEEDLETKTSPVLFVPASLTTGPQYGIMWPAAPGTSLASIPLPVPANDSVCFITGVWGKFRGPEDYVRIYKNSVAWSVGGNRGTGTPSADAMCLTNRMVVGAEANWSSGAAVPLPRAGGSGNAPAGQYCFFTKIQGDFRAVGSQVRLRIVNGEWRLDGTAGTQAAARCAVRTDYTVGGPLDEKSIFVDGEVSMPATYGPAINDEDDAFHFCSLTRVAGPLTGGWVATYTKPASGGGWKWLLGLGGGSGLPGLGLNASARCVI